MCVFDVHPIPGPAAGTEQPGQAAGPGRFGGFPFPVLFLPSRRYRKPLRLSKKSLFKNNF
jgi:hypothetical protein